MKKRLVFKWADAENKYMIWDLEPNEIVGSDYGYYKLDSYNFNFAKIDERRKMIDSVKMQKFLDSAGIKIPVEDFITLLNFQDYIHMMWPDHAKNRTNRYDVFKSKHRGKDNPMWLSDAFRWQIAACIECSLLAQMYLQHVGLESKLCAGNTFFEKNPQIEFGGGAHAYLVVHLGGVEYIYDPANPMLDSGNKPIVPRIMSFAKVPFKDRRVFKDLLNQTVADGGGFAYLEASDIYGVGSTWLYGFEGNDLVDHVSRRRTEQGIKRQVPNQPTPQHIYGQDSRSY